MARKKCSEELRRQAVDLYESISGDAEGHRCCSGVVRGTWRHWVDHDGTGKAPGTGAGTTTTSLTSTVGSGAPRSGSETPEQELQGCGPGCVSSSRSSDRPTTHGRQLRRLRGARARADAVLARQIRAVRAKDKTCGAPTAELNDGKPGGERVNQKRVARGA